MENLERTLSDIAKRVRRIENLLQGGRTPPKGPPPRDPNDDPDLEQALNKIDELSQRINTALTTVVQKIEIDDLRKEFDDLKRIVAILSRGASTPKAEGKMGPTRKQDDVIVFDNAASAKSGMDESIDSEALSVAHGEAYGD